MDPPPPQNPTLTIGPTGQHDPSNATAHSWEYIVSVHCPLALYLDRTLTPAWYVIGLIGNSVSVKIWSERRMRKNNSSAVYLVALSVSDLVFLVLHVLQELKYAWSIRSLEVPVVCEGYFLLVLVAQYLSPALVLGFTVERFIAVCRPFSKEKYCTSSRAFKVVVCLVVACTSLCAIQAYFWTYDAASHQCTVRTEVTEASLWSVWTWTSEMIIFFGVPLTTLVFNVLVIREVRRVTSSEPKLTGGIDGGGQGLANGSGGGGRGLYHGGATTAMLLSVSFYGILTTLPATLVYALHPEFPEGDPYLTDPEISEDPAWSRYLAYFLARKIVEEVCLSHYACNIFLYLVTGAQFRKSFVALVCRVNRTRGDSNDRSGPGTGPGAPGATGPLPVGASEIVYRKNTIPETAVRL